MSVFHIRRTAKNFNDACCRLLSLHGQVTSASIVPSCPVPCKRHIASLATMSDSFTSGSSILHMLQVPSKLRLNSSRLGDLSSAQYLVTGRRIAEMLKPPTANLILTNPDTNLSVICHTQVCVLLPSAGTSNFRTDERKMSWEGHSISVNHGRQITSFRKILPSRKRRKPPPRGMLACATPFSMLGANGDDLAKQMMVVLYWHDRPHCKYHHPRPAWRFSTDVTQSPSFASVLLC